MKKTILLVIALAIVLGAAYFAYGYLSENNKPDTEIQATTDSERRAAIDFRMADGSGNEVKLSDFYGRPIVLNFWTSWCVPCKSEMTVLDKLNRQMNASVQFLMVNVTDGKRETLASAKKFIQGNGYGFPVYYDNKKEGVAAYNLTAIPVTIIIDREGKIVKKIYGEIDEDALTGYLENLTGR